MKYAEHVAELIKTHKIKVKWLPKDADILEVRVDPDRVLHLYPVTNARTYSFALHEIGHLVTRTLHKPSLFKEAEAWQWAKTHALRWTVSMQTTLRLGLRSYIQRALADCEQMKSAQMLIPGKDHVFWELAADIPEVQKLLASGSAPWLAKHLAVIPWGNVLAHPNRPRCATCFFWKPAIQLSEGPKSKRDWGVCRHKATPLGSEMTPGGALCAENWMAI
jgi:hypothetical protein